MRTARKTRRVAAMAAVAAALASGLVSANATAAHASTSPCSYIVGDPEIYKVNGMKAGTIEQYYDPCDYWGEGVDGDFVAVWVWDQDFLNAYPNYDDAAPQLAFASMGRAGGAVYWFNTLYWASPYDSSVVFAYFPHSAAKPDSWRVGAMLDNSGCVAWTSQHYYATGTETAGPYAGCGDNVNIDTIPWTQPY